MKDRKKRIASDFSLGTMEARTNIIPSSKCWEENKNCCLRILYVLKISSKKNGKIVTFLMNVSWENSSSSEFIINRSGDMVFKNAQGSFFKIHDTR